MWGPIPGLFKSLWLFWNKQLRNPTILAWSYQVHDNRVLYKDNISEIYISYRGILGISFIRQHDGLLFLMRAAWFWHINSNLVINSSSVDRNCEVCYRLYLWIPITCPYTVRNLHRGFLGDYLLFTSCFRCEEKGGGFQRVWQNLMRRKGRATCFVSKTWRQSNSHAF